MQLRVDSQCLGYGLARRLFVGCDVGFDAVHQRARADAGRSVWLLLHLCNIQLSCELSKIELETSGGPFHRHLV